MEFEVKISKLEEEDNQIVLTYIDKIKFINDTVDDYAKDRTGNVVNKVKIYGEIKQENKDITKRLIDWSLANEKNEVYRKVEITAKHTGEIIREYVLDYAFIMDYSEKFEKEKVTYKLLISQRQANLNTIKAYS